MVPSQRTSIEWQAGGQSLKFTLSDYLAGEYPFRALISETPITAWLGATEPPLPPAEASERSLAGAVIRNLPFSGKLPTFRAIGPWLRYVPIRYTRFLVERTGTFEEYLEKFSSKSRKNLKRSVRKFDEVAGGACCWREYRTLADVEEFHRLAAGLSGRTYQTRLFDEGLSFTNETRRHLDELAADDRLRGYVLFYCNEPIAFALCEATGDVLLYKMVGHSPEHRDFSPGTVLLFHIIERFFGAHQFRYLDFGEGEGFYKQFFSNLELPCARVYYFKRTFRLVAVVGAHRLWNLALETATRFPGVPRLVQKLRQSLRRQAPSDGEQPNAPGYKAA